jgi:hypothetical protein
MDSKREEERFWTELYLIVIIIIVIIITIIIIFIFILLLPSTLLTVFLNVTPCKLEDMSEASVFNIRAKFQAVCHIPSDLA